MLGKKHVKLLISVKKNIIRSRSFMSRSDMHTDSLLCRYFADLMHTLCRVNVFHSNAAPRPAGPLSLRGSVLADCGGVSGFKLWRLWVKIWSQSRFNPGQFSWFLSYISLIWTSIIYSKSSVVIGSYGVLIRTLKSKISFDRKWWLIWFLCAWCVDAICM